MSGRKLASDEVSIKSAVALTDAYAGYVSDIVACKGHEYVALHLDYTYDSATSIEIKMQSSADGQTPWRDVQKSDDLGAGALDELTETLSANADLSHQWYTGPFNFVRFLAKRTGGSSSDTLALSWSGA